MEPKKDFSTAILDQKKAPNKLIVILIFMLFRLNRHLMIKIHQFNYHNLKWPSSKYLRAMLFLLKEKRENKHWLLH